MYPSHHLLRLFMMGTTKVGRAWPNLYLFASLLHGHVLI